MSGFVEIALDNIHKALVTGALSKGWGGPACRAALDIRTHIIESAFWLLIAAVSYYFYKVGPKFSVLCKNIQLDLSISRPNPVARTFELFLATIHFAMFLQIVYYKINILSLVNMIQPCHVILLLQGIALYSTGTTGVIISLCVLPSLTGTLLAMLFPDTGGLDQPFEMESYWIQHYLVQAVPLYLLVRRDYVALKNFSYFPVFCGLWVLLVAHFSLFEVSDFIGVCAHLLYLNKRPMLFCLLMCLFFVVDKIYTSCEYNYAYLYWLRRLWI